MTMKPLGSAITISAQGKPFRTSISPTETGVVIPLNSEQKAKALARMVEVANPNTVDRNLISSLESITGFPVIELTRTTFPKDTVDIVTTGFDFTINDIETCDRCIMAVQSSLVPLPEKQLEEQLMIMSSLVAKPAGESSNDVAFRIRNMAMQLSKYPADIVLKAIENVVKESTFWPSLSEYWRHIGWRMHKRNRLLESLTNKKIALMLENQ